MGAGALGKKQTMKFIIHSLKLTDQAIAFEKKLAESCYIPGRDTAQTHGDEILRENLSAMKESDPDVYVIWDGASQGTLFDMGCAYALGKKIHPIFLVPGRSWTDYFSRKINQIITYHG